jgi:fucose permease
MAVATSTRRMNAGLIALLVSYGGFILLGMPDAMLGVAWPSMQAQFGVPLEAMGILLLPGTIAYMLTSAASGRMITGLGLGGMLLAGAVIRGVGLLGYATVGTWELLLVTSFVSGIGSGAIDTGFNTYVATNHSAGRLGWLHAFFGVGATFGPWIMTRLLVGGQSWQTGYLLAAVGHVALIAALLPVMKEWRLPTATDENAVPVVNATPWQTLRRPVVWLAIFTFFIYTGIEVTGGNWAFTLFTEGRQIDEVTAGNWISIYWASLTAGRILTGMIADRVGPTRIVRWSMFGTVVGAVLVSVQNAPLISFLGLALVGFGLAAIFPTLIGITPGRFGQAHAANAIGFQIGAAGLGFAALPGLAGVLASSIGLEVIGPVMLGAAVLQWVLYEIGIRVAPVKQPGNAPAG